MMKDNFKDRKSSPRIKGFDYKGMLAYHITLCTLDKQCIFSTEESVRLTLDILLEDAEKEKFVVHTYCFMPDHLHALILGNDVESSLNNMMKRFKQRSNFHFRKRFGRQLWQRSYYDHVVRKDEDIEVIARYILGNPVRKGLVEDFTKYPYSGSVVTL